MQDKKPYPPYAERVAAAMVEHPQWRYGQAAYNCLPAYLQDEVVGTPRDPFYCTDTTGIPRVDEFIAWATERIAKDGDGEFEPVPSHCEHGTFLQDDHCLACEPRGTCGSWCNGCDECQPEQCHGLPGEMYPEPEQAPMTTEQVFAGYDEDGNELPDTTTSARCLPDCQGDCPVCLPPEEYDKLHGTTNNAPACPSGCTMTIASFCSYCAPMVKRAADEAKAFERARIERDVKVIPTHRIAYAKDGEVRERVPINEYRAAVLAAIRGGDDAS